jgi:hypothetical protein
MPIQDDREALLTRSSLAEMPSEVGNAPPKLLVLDLNSPPLVFAVPEEPGPPIEPVSTANPAGILTPNRRANSMVCNQISYAMEQGIFKRVSGKIFQGTGNFRARCQMLRF